MTVASTITVKSAGSDREIKMSYGLLTVLASHVGDPDRIPFIPMDHTLRDAVMVEMLAVREKGRPVEPLTAADIDIEMDDAENLIRWAQEHLIGFFLRSAKELKSQAERITTALAPSSSGTAS